VICFSVTQGYVKITLFYSTRLYVVGLNDPSSAVFLSYQLFYCEVVSDKSCV